MNFIHYKTKALATGGWYTDQSAVEIGTLEELAVFIQQKELEGKYVIVTFAIEVGEDNMMIESSTFAEHIHAITSMEIGRHNV